MYILQDTVCIQFCFPRFKQKHFKQSIKFTFFIYNTPSFLGGHDFLTDNLKLENLLHSSTPKKLFHIDGVSAILP